KSVYSEYLDHTSILQFVAEKCAPGTGDYSPTVGRRRKNSIRSVSAVLNLAEPRTDIPRPPAAPVPNSASFAKPAEVNSPMQLAFEGSAKWMVENHSQLTLENYPEISHWVLATTRVT